MKNKDIHKIGKFVIKTKSSTLLKLAYNLSTDIARTVGETLKTKCRLVVSGIGKSGQVSRKIAATLASTGTLARFVHATEGKHVNLKAEERHYSI